MLLPRSQHVSRQAQTLCLLILVVFGSRVEMNANEEGALFCRPRLTQKHRKEITTKLQRITGWNDLHFDSKGSLRLGRTQALGGSDTARTLIAAVLQSGSPIILEEANKRADIAFSQVSLASWKNESANVTQQVHVVSIDFSDFDHLSGHPMAMSAFDVGWALMHEFDHIINDSSDATFVDDSGDCETYINRMRQECNLPIRAHYFFTYVPLNTGGPFISSWVRMAFDSQLTVNGSKRRYWLIWDANLVGGTFQSTQLAANTRH